MKIARFTNFFSMLLLGAFLAGCAGAPQIRAVSKPSENKQQFLGLKKVAVLPFTNIGGDKGAEQQVMGILVSELNIRGTFEEVEDPIYVGSVLKSLKLRKIENLDVEIIRKMGSEMDAQALVLGEIHAWGLGNGETAAIQVSITMTLMDTRTGKPLWMGNGLRRASFTMSRALGLNEGPTDLEVARDVIISLVRDLDKQIDQRRKEELARIQAEEEGKLKAAAEAEKKKQEEAGGETGEEQ